MTKTLPEGLSEITRLFLDQLEGGLSAVDFDGVDLPEGWKFLGNGVSRYVFLSPDGWVYKIGESESNSSEVKTSQILYLESDSTVTFPYAEHVMDLDDDLSVMRMEYVEGTLAKSIDDFSWSEFRKIWRYISDLTYSLGAELTDLHGGNIVVRHNTPVVVDMAF